VITVLFCIDPVYLAIADFLIYERRLKYNHYIGIFVILCCSVVIGLSDIFYDPE
jgi:drug/metabolite transporter (DMT)-like permease